MPDITIRTYRPEDWTRLEAIHDSARKMELMHAGLDAAFLPLAIAAEREGLFEYSVWVAERDGEVVGFVAYTDEELAWLYVDPARMKGGIGRRLVQHFIDSTAKRPLSLEVLVGNDPAIRLYGAMGFVIEKTQSGRMPGNEDFAVTVHEMVLHEAS